MPRYRYMISFSFEAPTGIGFSAVEWPCDRQIHSMNDVTAIMNTLRGNGYVNAVVLGFSLFTDPAPTAAS